jgi:hypothetical protein
MSQEGIPSRRGFLAMLPALLVAVSGGRGWAAASPPQKKPHPEPRRGITPAHVVATKDLDGDKDVIAAFDLVREIPQVVDGIRCSCGCDEIEGYYSLLSCFEQDGMARHCDVCQGHARLIHRLHRQGKTLAQIRAAVDARFR